MVEIIVKNFGSIKAEFDSSAAPISVENFVSLCKQNFYEGLTFHRIIKGFMIQGGDGYPAGKQAAPIKGEFASNGVDNPIAHKRGIISMARTNDKNSASSQFFICDADSPWLDGQYAAFGQVVEGMDIVDAIADTPVIDGNGSVAKENQPVIETIRVID